LSITQKITFSLCLLIIFTVLTGFDRKGDPPKTECLECHAVLNEVLEYKYLHYPFKSNQCDACHDAETFGYTEEGARLCTVCHRDYEAEREGNIIHPVVEDCANCHDPHASQYAMLLIDQTPDLCYACHEGLPKEEKPASVHSSFEMGECASCHDPHISPNPSLLLEKTAQLCAQCHAFTEVKFSKAHLNLLKEDANCLSCHKGHYSSRKALVLENAHQPFSEGLCDSCHEEPEEQGKSKLTAYGVQLCTPCHSDIEQQIGSKFPHLTAEEDCLNCHGPHATDEDFLLLESIQELCHDCHVDSLSPDPEAYLHEPFSSSQCGDCHDPHGSEYKGILLNSEKELCLKCHSETAEQLEKEHSHTAVLQGCVACHEPHMGDQKAFLKEEGEALCFRCHESREKKIYRFVHFPYKEGNCGTCHLPHAGIGEANLKMEGDALCRLCHPSWHKSFPHPVGIIPSDELDIKPDSGLELDQDGKVICNTCHVPHSADIVFLLRSTIAGGEFCYQCHLR
jgi:predicted CXXCH cytochrome family protein